MRTLGDILLDLEEIIDEMVVVHELQCGDILNLIYGHLKVHNPDCIEEYTDDDTNPEFYYGPKR